MIRIVADLTEIEECFEDMARNADTVEQAMDAIIKNSSNIPFEFFDDSDTLTFCLVDMGGSYETNFITLKHFSQKQQKYFC